MYTITKGPSKLVTQRRTGPLSSQPVESKVVAGNQKIKPVAKPESTWSKSATKLVFNQLNGKRNQTQASVINQEDGYTLAHEENVRFVYEAWQQVEEQLDTAQHVENGHGLVQYVDKTPEPSLKNFVPFDLEEWWAQRFLANIENCS
ncbi:MAPK regulated corepressor interacting protein 2 isoform X2 [Protopterus annectens]|uniref:MAPK regulated corepressor interacting protein 2 isoform X2 n=1 Tax=Protopterus annectens TaxID=7888 RepID=UPI001CFB9285|nr:MAPK regulated corepressor interacting protein 2 isoform X2 [Protopterus annectens]